ncbi:Hypothetical protein PHPALM_2050 [Phytophthora palmivora]|uniref:Reverse transcriptase domain-containing protein n=1 Tax=Phytophthora palmivora TaxID=4796 RepID=A0A2P4YQQ9_9STRA|nr:Hypothetical protein PHPALM_2050 [Phytophthora palmivora]
MDDFPLEEPKLAVQYLCNALRPQALKSTIFSELKKTSNKPLKKSVTAFLNWLTPQVQSFSQLKEADLGVRPHQIQRPQIITTKCCKNGFPANSHTVFHCPGVTKEEALELIKERHKHGVGAVSSPGSGEDAMLDKPVMPCEINGAGLGNLTLDTGTENSIVAASLVKRLKAHSKWIATRSLDAPVEAEGFGGAKVTIAQEIKLSIAKNSQQEKGDILLSRPLMCKLGYDPAEILKHARMRNAIMDMEEISSSPGGMCHVMAISSAAASVEVTPEEIPLIEDEEQSGFPAVDLHRDLETAQQEVWQILLGKIKEAEAKGASAKFIKQLEILLWENVDVFRLKLGNDPPVNVPPLKVTLKPDAVPVRCKARRYPPQHRDFMRRHVEELVAAGLCYRNPRSKWASPPLIVNKIGPDPFRMTVDVRTVNAQTFYFLLDFFKGYWQFLLSLNSQELFSFLTDMGVFTPTRVLMGGTDSVAYCQATVQEMFADYLYKGLLIWLDDLLGYHSTEDGLFTLLKGVLKVCKVKG